MHTSNDDKSVGWVTAGPSHNGHGLSPGSLHPDLVIRDDLVQLHDQVLTVLTPMGGTEPSSRGLGCGVTAGARHGDSSALARCVQIRTLDGRINRISM